MPASTIESVKKKIRSYFPNAPLEILDKAYAFAQKAHLGQRRKGGEAFIIHPTAVAKILTDLKLDSHAIAAGLLHDTVEDTTVTLEDIRQHFGNEIAALVDGVTKLSKIPFTTHEEKQAENYRKMILAMSKDIRVIIIKLADRLNNMRTLKPLSHERQKIIAQETLEIYAPIANRLGLGKIKAELEDLCLKYLHPEAYKEISKKIALSKKKREKFIQSVCQILKNQLKEYNIESNVSGRAKHLFSIYHKMVQRSVPFEEIYDVTAFRIIVNNITECYRCLGIVHSIFKPIQGRFKDYIAIPKSNAYQSLHTTLVGPMGAHIEVQIRTPQMHHFSQQGIAAHWKYKEGHFDVRSYNNLDWVQRLLSWHQDLKDPKEFLETIKIDLFPEEVFIFTPKGEIKKLPIHSTAVDFAYSIHSSLGHRCTGAKINGKIFSLKKTLASGDMVEILTSKIENPSKDWLTFVKSSKAKAKIRQFFKSQKLLLASIKGKKILEKAFQNSPQPFSQIEKSKDYPIALSTLGIKSTEELLLKIGQEKITLELFFKKIFPKTSPLPLKPPPSPLEPLFLIQGIPNMANALAKCCAPIPGDPIIGIITRKQHIMIHHTDCKNVLHANISLKIPAEWNLLNTPYLHKVSIKIITVDLPGVLARLSQVISANHVNIISAHIHTTHIKRGIFIFTIQVMNTEQLTHVIQKIRKESGVFSVMRYSFF